MVRAGEAATGKAAAQAQSPARQDGQLWWPPSQPAPSRETQDASTLGRPHALGGRSNDSHRGAEPAASVPRLGLKFSAGRATSTCQVLTPGCCQLRRLAAAFQQSRRGEGSVGRRTGVGEKTFSPLWFDPSFYVERWGENSCLLLPHMTTRPCRCQAFPTTALPPRGMLPGPGARAPHSQNIFPLSQSQT